MDPVRLGRQGRALRRRRGWRQADLARAARTSRMTFARVELGEAEELTLRSLHAVSIRSFDTGPVAYVQVADI